MARLRRAAKGAVVELPRAPKRNQRPGFERGEVVFPKQKSPERPDLPRQNDPSSQQYNHQHIARLSRSHCAGERKPDRNQASEGWSTEGRQPRRARYQLQNPAVSSGVLFAAMLDGKNRKDEVRLMLRWSGGLSLAAQSSPPSLRVLARRAASRRTSASTSAWSECLRRGVRRRRSKRGRGLRPQISSHWLLPMFILLCLQSRRWAVPGT